MRPELRTNLRHLPLPRSEPQEAVDKPSSTAAPLLTVDPVTPLKLY